jgi:phospholipase C
MDMTREGPWFASVAGELRGCDVAVGGPVIINQASHAEGSVGKRTGTLAKLSVVLIVLSCALVGCSGSGEGKGALQAALLNGKPMTCHGVVTDVRRTLRSVTAGAPSAARRLASAARVVGQYESEAPKGHSSEATAVLDGLASVSGSSRTSHGLTVNPALPAAAKDLAALNRTCSTSNQDTTSLPVEVRKIKHVVIIMQENRSFDHYFGTYPGADGIPEKNGVFTVCLPNPATGGCSAPHHASGPTDHGGPHTYAASEADIDHGKMDGFIRQWEATRKYCHEGDHASRPTCEAESAKPDVMGYHDRADIPNYWAYADNFVLQDHMFEPNLGWSQPSHLSLVSGWSAVCRNPYHAETCRPSVTFNDIDPKWPHQPSYAWTDITYLLHSYGVSWRYYVAPGSVNDCEGTNDQMIHCTPGVPGFEPIGTPEPWNPLPDFTDVRADHQVKNVRFNPKFFASAAAGTLPSVSWVEPGWYDSEHPPTSITDGQAWVTRVINAAMEGPDWKDTVVFLAWDDWGGFYDHMAPPSVDGEGYGLRVPGLMISPYAKHGYIDHQTYSFDVYLRFIEDLFMRGQRLDPYTDGRWDPRPDIRDNAPILGNLMHEFDFQQPPRRPLILPVRP